QPQDGFQLPTPDMLATSNLSKKDKANEVELRETADCLQETLESFSIFAEVVGWVAGPTVTLFKVDLPSGVRVSRITALEQDIALALAAPGVRIFAPIPGTNYVGIEVPNRTRQTVLLGDVLKDAQEGPLQVAIGKDVEGRSIVSDLSKMPHLLIGGTTGSGKSVSVNAMIMSILMRATPAEVRFIMIDPKRVEFTPYNGIPHLYVPVVTEAREAASALSWGVAEMERRLKVFSKVGARNIGQYNAKVQAELAEQQKAADEGKEPAARALGDELPYIVIIIDELADLMMNVGKEVEFSISRIAQLARAAGIHLIVATQRPSTNVVTGLIKANITNRIAFNVASGIDSRVVLDTPGAERLIGLGDLLLSKPELAKPQRIQGCYVSEDEINAVVDMLKEQGEPEYHSEILQTNLITLGASQPDGSGGSCSDDDPLIWEAADIVVSSALGSTSNIQRRLKVGYSRAGRIMDMLEDKGVVGPPNGSKPRDVLVDAMELETLKAFEAQDSGEE
ncbi:DNA translocase FtsK, partial [Gordonibacter sp.]